MPFGYWEAKDAKDDLDAEIEFKFKRGYPQDNIIFEDSTKAVLIQHREEVMRCDVADVKALEKLLKLFKKPPRGWRFIGGESGIRTRGGCLAPTRFPGVRLKPLIHLSAAPRV